MELKAKSVFFSAAATENLESGYLRFKRIEVNLGGGMSELKFTVPVSGFYHFQLNAIVKNLGTNFVVSFLLGGVLQQNFKVDCNNCSTQVVSLVKTCYLKPKEEVYLHKAPGTSGIITGGGPYDSFSTFTGWLVEEV